MCYSARCSFEDFYGNCRFPNDKIVRNKYKHPFCPQDFMDDGIYSEYVKDVKNLLERKKKVEFLISKTTENV